MGIRCAQPLRLEEEMTEPEMISISHWGMFPAPPRVRRLEDVLPMYPRNRVSGFFTAKQAAAEDDFFKWVGR